MRMHAYFWVYATVLSERIDDVRIETCIAARLPDTFRTEHFAPLTQLELPAKQGTDEELEKYLRELRAMSDDEARVVLCPRRAA